MYREGPLINTRLEALDELADVRMTLSGASAFASALAQSEMAEPEAIRLMSCLLNYCALTAESACKLICGEEQNDLA